VFKGEEEGGARKFLVFKYNSPPLLNNDCIIWKLFKDNVLSKNKMLKPVNILILPVCLFVDSIIMLCHVPSPPLNMAV